MSVLPIRHLGDPILRHPCRAVSFEELATPKLQTFIDDLIETMHHANGAGLAAPQVGEAIRVAAVHIKDNPRYPYKPNFPLTVFVNPELTLLGSAQEIIYEGCLSVPNLRGQVRRCMHVRVDAWDRWGQPFSVVAKGLTAGTFQHELDHLDGIVFVDRVDDSKSLCTWSNFELHHKEQFVSHAENIVRRYGS